MSWSGCSPSSRDACRSRVGLRPRDRLPIWTVVGSSGRFSQSVRIGTVSRAQVERESSRPRNQPGGPAGKGQARARTTIRMKARMRRSAAGTASLSIEMRGRRLIARLPARSKASPPPPPATPVYFRPLRTRLLGRGFWDEALGTRLLGCQSATYGLTILAGTITRSNSASLTKPSCNAAAFNVKSCSMA
jgi:hypothetical protein